MEEADAELKLISKVYHAPDGGKPVYKTWQDARELNPLITIKTVRYWFKQNIQPKGQVWGKRNSYVAQGPFIEYQADLFFITKKQFANQTYDTGLSMIDVFSKYAVVLPVDKKKAEPLMDAIFEAFKLMGKQPEILYTDNEGGLNNKWVPGEFEKAGIKHVVAGTAYFVERFNRSFKNRMANRLKELLRDKRIIGKQPKKEPINYQWHDLIPFVMAEYNAKNKHRITGMTPYEARKPSNEADVKAAIELAATHGVKFPPLG